MDKKNSYGWDNAGQLDSITFMFCPFLTPTTFIDNLAFFAMGVHVIKEGFTLNKEGEVFFPKAG